jgi:hypothetical protein
MDRRTLDHYLAQTDDQIDQATERLERQSRIIERLKSGGRDTTADELLLACFERTLESIRSERRSIIHLLNALKGPSSNAASRATDFHGREHALVTNY